MKKNYDSVFVSDLRLLTNSSQNTTLFYRFFIVLFFFGISSSFAQFPDDFAKVELASGMTNTTSFEFAPDGRIFLLDRHGELLIYKSSLGLVQSAGTIDVHHEQEDGLLAIAFDPAFTTNNFIYLYYSPGGAVDISRVSRFTMIGDVLDNSSEVILLEWSTDRSSKYHYGGDMDFDSNGNLYISTGDNTTYPNLYAPIAAQNTDTPSNRDNSAEKSSSNTNDYRGKILRITPQPNGTVTIPTGNLFPGGVGGLEEIYVMGARNPYRIFIDKNRNDWLFWGEVGPDAPDAGTLGPVGFDEINLTKTAGNYGWPYFSGKDNLPYQVPYNGSPPFYNNPLAPVNTSVFNTGSMSLPPAQSALMSFGGRRPNGTQLWKCLLAGFRYDFDPNPSLDQQRLPIEFDDAFFFMDFNSSNIYVVNLDANGNVIQDDSTLSGLPRLAPSVFPNSSEGFIDMELGPDGKIYILAYGFPFGSNSGPLVGRLYRVDYTGITTNSPPVIQLSATPTNGDLPLTVDFSTAGTVDPDGDSPLTYEWDFDGDGNPDSTDPNPTQVFTNAGTFNVQLRVSDGNPDNGLSIKNVTIYAGNNLATFTLNNPVPGGLFNWGDDVNIDIAVQDQEDGAVDCNNVSLIPGFGHLNHVHPETSTSTCPQLIRIEADANHGIDGELDIFGSFELSYTDTGGLLSATAIDMHPKRKEAEFFSTQSGTSIIPNNDPLEGGLAAMRVSNGSHMSFAGRNLLNIDGVKYRVASDTGGSIQLRVGSVAGPILATTTVPATGGEGSWSYIESSLVDPGGQNDLYFVFSGGFDLDYIEFLGDGISIDNSPPIVERVRAESATIVSVKFSEYLNEVSAESLANYSIDNGITITSAELQLDDRTVYLTTSPLSSEISYLLSVQNVQNTSGLGIALDTYTFSIFNGSSVNAGGPEIIAGGNTFIADNYNSGGLVFSTSEAIDGTTDDELYQTERYGPAGGTFSYDIPVGAAAEYDIRLHFAEIYYGLPGGGSTGGVGSRIFNVSIEGTEVLTNFDILSEVSPATALTKEFDNVLISDGAATIEFTGLTESAKISAIEVLDSGAFDNNTSADIAITSPSNGWDVNQPFEVAFRVENWTILEGDTHAHYYIDDMMEGPHYSYEPIRIDNLSLGSHTIKIELFNPDHTPTGIFDEVTVNVTGVITCNETPFPDQWGVKQLETTSLPHRSVYTFADYDLDGDGLKDIVTGGWWYKNPGTISGNWVRSDIGNLFDNVAHVYDFDNDNDLDLLGVTSDVQSPVGYTGAQLVWAQNDGSGNFTVFTNIPAGDTNYSEPFLAGLAGGVFSAGGPYQMAINWNGAETTNSPMQMLTPTADPVTGTWSLVDIVGAVSTGEDIQAGDIDQDNDLDLFQGSNWVRNNGGTWSTHSTGITYPTTPDRAQLADFNRDGRLDAVVGQLSLPATDPEFSQLAWFAAPANLASNPDQNWVRNILPTDINGSLSVFATDIDFDGDTDIVVGEWRGEHRLIAFENNLCDDGTFVTQILDPGGASATFEHHDGARVTDIDNDGDLDIISNGWVHNFPRIYENATVPVGTDDPIVDAGADQTVMPGGTANLSGSATDPDGGAITAYLWTQLSGPNTAILSGETTTDVSASGLIEGTYVFRLTATDDESDTGFDDATVTVSNQVPSIRINSGGPMLSFNGTDWSADQYFNGGGIFDRPIDIANTSNDELYQTERYATSGPLIYEIPVSNGDHNVNLHFAETFYGAPGPGASGGVGSRVFNIDIEGQQQISNYDIVVAAGGSVTAVVENFTGIAVNDGSLTITLSPVTEFPKISGIEIIGAGGNAQLPIADAGPDQTIFLPADNLIIDGSGSDPDGGSITAFQWSQESGPSTATLTNTNTDDLTASDLLVGTYVFRLTVTDDENETNFDDVTVVVESEPATFYINSGGPAISFDGIDWSADNSFIGGTTFENVIPIANTENDQLYQTERFDSSGTLLYEIPVSNGTYSLDLHFAELFYGVGSQAGGAGSRVFNITIENGQGELTNYDIIVAAGASATAVVESFTGIDVTDGNLTVTLTSVTEFPKISGIAVFETRPPMVDAGIDQSTTLPADSAVFNGTAVDPDGGMITIYQWTQESGPGTATLTGADTADLTATDLVEGEYMFRLTVTDDEGEMAFDDVVITVLPEVGSGDAPVAVAEATPSSGGAPLMVSFTGSNSTDNESIASYMWDFGDGMNSTEADPEHIYTEPGMYTVVLTVTDDGGLTDTDTLMITVLTGDGTPIAVAEATPTTGPARLLVTFTGSNSADDGEIVGYLWDFGDGTTSTEADLEKIYEVPGTYEVTLTVTDDGGLTATDSLTIVVEDDPTSGKMDIILQSNPPNPADGGFANVQIINQPTDAEVMNITLHDVGGRYLRGYLAEEIEQNGIYRIPVATLGDGIYFVRVAMSQGETTLIKLWIRN